MKYLLLIINAVFSNLEVWKSDTMNYESSGACCYVYMHIRLTQ